MIVHHFVFPSSTVRSFLRSILQMPFRSTFRIYHSSFEIAADEAVLVATTRIRAGEIGAYDALVELRREVDNEISTLTKRTQASPRREGDAPDMSYGG